MNVDPVALGIAGWSFFALGILVERVRGDISRQRRHRAADAPEQLGRGAVRCSIPVPKPARNDLADGGVLNVRIGQGPMPAKFGSLAEREERL